MQVVPGNAFQNTVAGAAAAQPTRPHPAADPQMQAQAHAARAGGASQAALNAVQQKAQLAAASKAHQTGGTPAQHRSDAPRGSVLNITV